MARQSVRQLTIYGESASIRVVIVERRAHIRKELRSLLEQDGGMEIAGATRFLGKVLPLIRAHQPDVVRMEAGHPDGDRYPSLSRNSWAIP